MTLQSGVHGATEEQREHVQAQLLSSAKVMPREAAPCWLRGRKDVRGSSVQTLTAHLHWDEKAHVGLWLTDTWACTQTLSGRP